MNHFVKNGDGNGYIFFGICLVSNRRGLREA